MTFPRESGVLLHPTSLPGPYGIGEIGSEAELFVRKLAAMGQHLWQVLPLGPTSFGDSPYQSLSSFAGNHLLIDFQRLHRDGLLLASELPSEQLEVGNEVDYGQVIPQRGAVLHQVASQFKKRASSALKARFDTFIADNHERWLADYSLYLALKQSFSGKPWYEWPQPLVTREPQALRAARDKQAQTMELVAIQQFLFFDQWARLRDFCAQQNVRIMGDIPIFVAHDSADVWANPQWFHLDDSGHTTVVAGVPPDYFSETGQRWGNPLYRWELMEADGFSWWKNRLAQVLKMFDMVRVDHFRGFEAYWEIPADEPTAVAGRWVPGPGAALFLALRESLGEIPIIAEDLGTITPAVESLREGLGLPGMRVLQFALVADEVEASFKPHLHPQNTVCYTGTHDNDTTRGWFESLPRDSDEYQRWLRYLGTDGSEIHWDLISVAMRSRSNTVIVPLQDILGLGSEARLNLPGRQGGNWRWRVDPKMLTEAHIRRMRALTEESRRLTG